MDENIMKVVNILMIGNSFSVDAARYTHDLSLGGDTVIELGVLYVGGCSLESHVKFFKNNEAPYEWFINGESTGRYISLKEALEMKKWDYITMQQVSVFSGLKDTFYPYINELVDYVRKYQKEATLVLHKTWPYEEKFDNENFKWYHYNSEEMYEGITKAYDFVKQDLNIKIIIRSGDAIYEAIKKYGSKFHKDGFHLSDEGRYIAALTFVHTFNNNQQLNNLYIPEGFDKNLCFEYEKLVSSMLSK